MADLGGRPFPSRVALFVTCLGDMFYPEAGETTVRLLHRVGIAVDFPLGQTCCGQPAFNAGFHQQAREVARRNLTLFANAEYIVIPSGSCTSMWRIFYPELFADDPILGEQAEVLAARTYPMNSQEAFLDRVRRAMHKEAVGQASRAPWLWHDNDIAAEAVALRARLALQRPMLVERVQHELSGVRGVGCPSCSRCTWPWRGHRRCWTPSRTSFCWPRRLARTYSSS